MLQFLVIITVFIVGSIVSIAIFAACLAHVLCSISTMCFFIPFFLFWNSHVGSVMEHSNVAWCHSGWIGLQTQQWLPFVVKLPIQPLLGCYNVIELVWWLDNICSDEIYSVTITYYSTVSARSGWPLAVLHLSQQPRTCQSCPSANLSYQSQQHVHIFV